MNDDFQHGVVQGSDRSAAINEGLRAFMLRIYNYMAIGLSLTGVVAYLVASSPTLTSIFLLNQVVFWIVALSPLALVFFLSARIGTMSAATAQTVFWIYAALNGLSLGTIFLVYTGTSIAKVFFITAGTFAAMSLYGYTTKRDLTGIGSFLFMGLIGLILASVANIFFASPGLSFVISIVGVLIFVGLTAYDTQKLKSIYLSGIEEHGQEAVMKTSIMGALSLYLDFLNLFIFLLRFMGERR